MSADQGSQIITLDYFAPANSTEVNKRNLNIMPTGIYDGGILSIVNNSTCQVSTFVAEISDGTYQVRCETQSTVNVSVAAATPYVVIRWSYNAVQNQNFSQILAVATPNSNDLIIGLCEFTGANLSGFDYVDSDFPRSDANTQDLWLKPIPTSATELAVRILGGKFQNESQNFDIPNQKTSVMEAPATNSKIFLVYVNSSTGAIEIDSSGTAAASPSAPDYDGRLVLAEVTIAAGQTNVTSSHIKDVRPFLITPPKSIPSPDNTTIEISGDQYRVKDRSITATKASRFLGANIVPGWYVKFILGVKTKPSDFDSSTWPTGRLYTDGSIFLTGQSSFSVGISQFSYLYQMKVYNNSGANKTMTQKIIHLDNNAYFYLNDSVTPFATKGLGSQDEISWILQPGENNVQIVIHNQGSIWAFQILGALINGTDVYFNGNVT